MKALNTLIRPSMRAFRTARRRTSGTFIAVLAVALTAAMATPAAAATVRLTDRATVAEAEQIDELLAFYPGSRKIDDLSVEVEPGVAVSPPTATTNQTCSYYYLCLWSGQNYSGYKISFYTCAFRNLGNYSYPGGGNWNDKVSSLINNQTSGTRSRFYNYISGGNWDYLFTSRAYNARPTLPTNNNRIDGVDVC